MAVVIESLGESVHGTTAVMEQLTLCWGNLHVEKCRKQEEFHCLTGQLESAHVARDEQVVLVNHSAQAAFQHEMRRRQDQACVIKYSEILNKIWL